MYWMYYTLASGLHERAAYLHNRSVLRRCLRRLVVNSGADFDPASCVPAPAGSFVHRVAGTPHYDEVIRSQNDPCGHRNLRYRSNQLRARRTIETPLAGGVIDNPQPRCDLPSPRRVPPGFAACIGSAPAILQRRSGPAVIDSSDRRSNGQVVSPAITLKGGGLARSRYRLGFAVALSLYP